MHLILHTLLTFLLTTQEIVKINKLLLVCNYNDTHFCVCVCLLSFCFVLLFGNTSNNQFDTYLRTLDGKPEEKLYRGRNKWLFPCVKAVNGWNIKANVPVVHFCLLSYTEVSLAFIALRAIVQGLLLPKTSEEYTYRSFEGPKPIKLNKSYPKVVFSFKSKKLGEKTVKTEPKLYVPYLPSP